MMRNDDFKLLRGFDNERTNGRTDICDCRVAFATDKKSILKVVSALLKQAGKLENIRK